MVAVYGEVAADGETLVLLAGGDDAEVARAAKILKTLTPRFSQSNPPGALTGRLTWPTIVQLSAAFGETWVPGPKLCAWIEDQVRRRTAVDGDSAAAAVSSLSVRWPEHLTPYPWQLEGAAIIGATGRALITDEPGTGKTITTILGLLEWEHRKPDSIAEDFIGPVIVVCPASVVDPWVEAWHTWAPEVSVATWRGPKRGELAGAAEVYVTSYDTARADAAEAGKGAVSRRLLDLEPVALVVDECHLIKNQAAHRSRAVRRLARAVDKRGGAVVALSGTPITHHPGDLWPTLSCIEPDAWPSHERWVTRYCQTLPGEYSDEILGLLASREPEFRLTTLGQSRRVAKADVLDQLPPKIYSVRTVELPAKWRKVYDSMESQMLAELPDGSELSTMSVLTKLLRLGQLASAPADVTTTYETDADGQEVEHVTVTLREPSWKVAALLDVLEEHRPGEPGAPADPVVCFAPSRQLIELAGAAAADAGFRVGYIVGGQSAKDRTATIAGFQAHELDVICVTTGAGGVGITLTAARTCVFLQRPWALVDAVQAEDRLHRIGAEGHDSIEVIDIVASNTIDSRIRAVLRERAGQLADLVQDPRIVTELLGGKETDSSGRKTSMGLATADVEATKGLN